MKLPIKISAFLLFTFSFSYGQMAQYDYKRELKGVSQQWHKLTLPDDIFGKSSQDLTDIRIFGITASNDTIESPYLLNVIKDKISNKEVAFKTLNASHNNTGYYFTFEIPIIESINQINLEFKQQNFDWQIKLEGSQDQDEWFTVLEDYRILSIKNGLTDFQFTKLAFPNSRYRFYRLLIDSKEKPELTVASISKHEVTEGTFRNYQIKNISSKENKRSNQTELDVELQEPIRVSHLRIVVSDNFDYYRPVTVKYLTDSIKTEQGWKYNYSTLTSGILNSMEDSELKFGSTTVHRLKLFIHNQDNQPLTIDTIQVKGYVTELVARFTDQANYFLTYGNKSAARSQYDIDRFGDQIPEALSTLELGSELIIDKEENPVTGPLFKSEIWLWTIIIVIILLLGWFSIKMIRKKE